MFVRGGEARAFASSTVIWFERELEFSASRSATRVPRGRASGELKMRCNLLALIQNNNIFI